MAPTIFSYFFGSIYAFSDYFISRLGIDSISIYFHESQLAFGYYSFKPFFELFGGNKIFPMGYYEDFYNFNDIIKSNIFTYYRQLIQDFGILGSLIFILFMGITIHFFYFQMLMKKAPFFSIAIFIIFLVFLGISYLINAFTARTVIVVGIALYYLLKINFIFYKNNNKQMFSK
jgi:hypothetical protein